MPTPALVIDTLTVIPVTDQPLPKYEGRRKHLSPEAARSIRLEVCPDHFPKGTQAWSNLVTAVRRLDAARRVNLSLTVVHADRHLEPRKLFAPPRPGSASVIRVEYSTENPKGKELDASGAAFQFHESTRRWRWGDNDEGVASHSAVVALNPQRGFRRHSAHPLRSDPAYAVEDAPSVGVFSHEIGHALGFGHDERRSRPALVGLAVHRGFGRHLTHGVRADGTTRDNADQRQGRISAYGQWALQTRYPTAKPKPDTKPEWHLHEVVAFAKPPAWAPKSDKPTQAFELDDLVPRLFQASPLGYVDCRTGRPAVLHLQYSDTSNVAQPGTSLTVRVQMGPLGTVAERSHTAQHPSADYAQYTWVRSLHLDPGTLDPTVVHKVPLEITVGDPASEIDPDDNSYRTSVLLFPENTVDRRCVDARASGPR
ncbi:MAG: hypothetical protein ACI8PZ_000161 [Myxococcota bacterium]